MKEFFLFLRDRPVLKEPHWKPQTKQKCGICRIHYDYIIKLENIQEELPIVYRDANDGVEMLKKFPMPGDKFSERKKWHFLSQVPYTLVNETLHKVYHGDYTVFSYQYPSFEYYKLKTG